MEKSENDYQFRMMMVVMLLALVFFLPELSFGGDLEPPSAPGEAGSESYTLGDIYNRLDSGAPGAMNNATEPTADPEATQYTMNEIMEKAPEADNTDGASESDVVAGKKFWGLTGVQWGPRTGSLAAQTVDNTMLDQLGGIYGAFNLSVIDTDLSAANIKNGVEIYGVSGTVIQAAGNATAGEVLSGKTFSNDSGASTGTMPTQTLLNTSTTVSAGYYAATTLDAVDTDLSAANIKNGVDIYGVSGTVIQAAGNATAGEVLSGKTFSNDSGASTGTMPTQTLLNTSTTVSAGYYAATTLDAVDTDLATGNIKSGVNIFGIDGDSNVVDTSTGDATASDITIGKKAWVDGAEITGTAGALVPKTKQTVCYDAAGAVIACTGTGQDGELQEGQAWPNPRFTDNSDGTVTDNITRLVWLKKADCFPQANWTTALTNANGLADGQCDLTDGSSAGEWCLPNVNELSTLPCRAFTDPALSDTVGTAQWADGDPFTGIHSDHHWSSSNALVDPTRAWLVGMRNGFVIVNLKTELNYVLPVRTAK